MRGYGLSPHCGGSSSSLDGSPTKDTQSTGREKLLRLVIGSGQPLTGGGHPLTGLAKTLATAIERCWLVTGLPH